MEETDTIWLLSIEGTCVEKGTPMATEVKAKNTRYQELCAKNAAGNESLVERGAQTVSSSVKHKETQVAPRQTRESGCQASESDIYESFGYGARAFHSTAHVVAKFKQQHEKKEGTKAPDTTPATSDGVKIPEIGSKHVDKQLMKELDAEPGTYIDTKVQLDSSSDTITARQNRELQQIKSSSSFLNHIASVERILIQNQEHAKHLVYRGTADDVSESASGKGLLATHNDEKVALIDKLVFLWSFFHQQLLDKFFHSTGVTWNQADAVLKQTIYLFLC